LAAFVFFEIRRRFATTTADSFLSEAPHSAPSSQRVEIKNRPRAKTEAPSIPGASSEPPGRAASPGETPSGAPGHGKKRAEAARRTWKSQLFNNPPQKTLDM